MGYEERQAEKAEYYKAAAEKAKQQSEAAYNASSRLAESIPFGQPILIGHHSEGRHRRDIERIRNNMDRSLELGKKADYYEQKAANAANPAFISSDDENAITKLKEKLAGLEAEHARLKALPLEIGHPYSPNYAQDNAHLGKVRHSYDLPYNKAEQKRVKDRIASLEQKAAMPELSEQIGLIHLKTCKEENRVRLLFPNIPSEAIRAKLKQNGFRWSPFNQAWQRQISPWVVQLARDIAKEASEG